RRSGGLWQGRYKSSYLQTDLYLLSCMRYIELNPVRAAMVAAPGNYRWSSYQTNALGVVSSRITPHDVYCALDSDIDARFQAYRNLFASHVDDP
ncbi:transposase, partial [bacterium]|nr:transposase [bacterium]